MPEFKATRVYETTFPVATMPRADVGQIDFSVEAETISFLLPRHDFEQLGQKIVRLLAETRPPSPTRVTIPPTNEEQRHGRKPTPGASRREADGADTPRIEAFDLLDTRPRILGKIWL
jgi:hypothetical protein